MNNRYNVLYIAETASGGSAFSLFNLVREIKKGNTNPIILFIKENNPHIVNQIREQNIEVLSFDNKRLGGSQIYREKKHFKTGTRHTLGNRIRNKLGNNAAEIYFSLKSFYLFCRYQAALILPIYTILKRKSISTIHLNNGLENGLCAILGAKLAGVAVVCHNRMFSRWTGFEKLFIPSVNKYISISQAVFDNSVAYGVPPEKGIVIHNALDLKDYAKPYDVNQIKKEFGWKDDIRVVANIGRIARWKGHEFFLHAMSKICAKDHSIRGLIVGEQSYYKTGEVYYQYLVSLAERLGLKDKVIFTGFRDDIPQLIAAVDILVHSSIEPEPFGRVVIEGMASGKPVIATSAGGVLEIIEDQVNGLLVPCRDVKAMARAIDTLLANPVEAEKIGSRAKKSVKRRFLVQHHAAKVERVYASLKKKP